MSLSARQVPGFEENAPQSTSLSLSAPPDTPKGLVSSLTNDLGRPSTSVDSSFVVQSGFMS